MCKGSDRGVYKDDYYGIIGCGLMGHEHLRNIALLEGTNVSVIFEPNPEMAKSAATHEPDARLVSSLDELLQFPNLDCLVITMSKLLPR